MSCTSCLIAAVPEDDGPSALLRPRLEASASSRAYIGTCDAEDQREFLRIAVVTDRISEHISCLLDIDIETGFEGPAETMVDMQQSEWIVGSARR